jgi:hypothetical protein
MTCTARQPYKWLTLVTGLLAALIWASLGLRAVVMENDPSGKALFACAALVLAGFALGSATWILNAPRRAKRPPDPMMLADMKAPSVLLGIMLIGLGAGPMLDPSPGAWEWALMVAASLVGGLNLGVAFMGFADQGAPNDASHQSMGAPPSGS